MFVQPKLPYTFGTRGATLYAALADVVQQGGELARQQIRVFVSGGRRGHKADVLRDCGRAAQGVTGSKCETRPWRLSFVAALEPQARAVGHKHLVKQAALGGLGDLDVVVDVGAGIDLRSGWRQAAMWWP